jgi:hypothetical protein
MREIRDQGGSRRARSEMKDLQGMASKALDTRGDVSLVVRDMMDLYSGVRNGKATF